MKKLLVLLLVMCLSLGYMSGTVSATEVAAQELTALELGKSVTFTVTREAHAVEYGFTAPEAGTFVLYDVDGGIQSTQLLVERVTPEQETETVARGSGRVAFSAETGERFRFTIDCSFKEVAMEFEFMLAMAVEPQALGIAGSPLAHGFVGEEGTLRLEYAPANAASQIQWTSTDPAVVTVEGDDTGASFRFVGAGTAEVVGTSANGLQVRHPVTVLALDQLVLDGTVTHTISANGGEYAESQHDLCFTPDRDGTYVLSVSYDPSVEQYHGLQMSTGSGEGSVRGEKVLRFQGKAGQHSHIHVEFWGAYEKDITYSFRLTAGVPAGQIRLEPELTEGYAGTNMGVGVVWLPESSLPEPLEWTVSDETVVKVRESSMEFAVVDLLAPGTATVTATTADGKSDSFQIQVYSALGLIEMEQDVATPVTLLGESSVEVSFTPSQTGHYHFTSSVPELSAHLYADTVSNAGATLYHLDAGTTYYGTVDNRTAQTVSGELYITWDQVLIPVELKITKQPDNTTYLKGMLDSMWVYQLLAGLEMEVGWSDGSKTQWSFDEEGPYVGTEFLSWDIQDQKELVLQCHGIKVSIPLTVVDKKITGIALEDPTPLEIVERSSGMDMGDGEWYYSPYLYEMRAVRISFSDGTTVSALPETQVYGIFVTCQDDQAQTPWVKGGKGSVVYSYDEFSVTLEVRVVESPVVKLELVELPVDTIEIGDSRFFAGDDDAYFAPKDLRALLEGMVLKIVHQDGTERIVTVEDLQWQTAGGVEHPYVDGYPLGAFGDLILGNELISGPCERESLIEYKGQSVSYTIRFVEKTIEPVDPTDPTEPSVTDPTVTEPTVTDPTVTEPTVTDPTVTEPSVTDPTVTKPTVTDPTVTGPTVTEPTVTEPTETEPSVTESTPSDPQPTEPPQTAPPVDRDGDKTGPVIAVVVVLLAAAAAALLVPKLKKDKTQN